MKTEDTIPNTNLKEPLARTWLTETMRKACKKIAPLWPLENFVAVNPYLGLTDKKFDAVAQNLADLGGIQTTLPVSFYLEKLQKGEMKTEDLAEILKRKGSKEKVEDFIATLYKAEDSNQEVATITTVVDVATRVTGKDWVRFMTNRISVWAASYFDNGQATWSAAHKESGVFSSWKSEASIDRTTSVSGLKNFRKLVEALPNDPIEATEFALKKLQISEDESGIYLHKLLIRIGGWSAHAARLDWDAELYGGKDGVLIEFLAVLACWEACLLEGVDHSNMSEEWSTAKKSLLSFNMDGKVNERLAQKLILQEAFDLSMQRNLIGKFKAQKSVEQIEKKPIKAQAVFCIDVRSEVYRRNLEMVDDQFETVGFAGFFAFSLNYVPIGHQEGEAQCPVLLKTGPKIREEIPDKAQHQKALNDRLVDNQLKKTWKSFKSGAVTCFSFVSPVGLSYLPKLFTDSFGLTRPVPHPDNAGMKSKYIESKNVSIAYQSGENENLGIALTDQIQMAKNALKAMSFSDNLAPYVMLVGHGSSTVNNPHATGLDCGACGGHTGEANAKVAAAVLNNPEVREGLKKEDVNIPEKTVFLACLHDTTTDEVTIFNQDLVPQDSRAEVNELKKSLAQAGQATRTERASRMTIGKNTDIDTAIKARSRDWSQVRPEWGLAGCSSFVVAPRDFTRNVNLEGKSFLHSYNWKNDDGFGILELIMTAPMVVTSWINLQYYASTVDNKYFGSGNKTLHNVTSGIGVLEGYAGDMRVGLPMQSIHDGEKYQNEPLKLNVIIAAPMDAMNNILAKHPSVKNLCDNGWIYLFHMNDEGEITDQYLDNLHWGKIS